MFSTSFRSSLINIRHIYFLSRVKCRHVFLSTLNIKNQTFLDQNQNSSVNDETKNIYSQKDTSSKLLKVAIIGEPNAGKSTLINNLMDRKVCPASNKVHTTRKRSQAIITENETQIVFLDTPGIVSSKEFKRYNLEKSFTKDCTKSLHEADIIGVIHDVSNTWKRERLNMKIINLLDQYKTKYSFLVLNKIDTLKSKRKLLDITRILTENCSIPYDSMKLEKGFKTWPHFREIFMVSAINTDGLQDLKKYLMTQAQPAKWLYPANQWTDHSFDDIIIRTVQATLLDFLPQEIPYRLNTKMELFEIMKNGIINAVVLVHCPIERIQKLVVGVGDGKLRQITEKAQNDLLHTFDQPVRLRIVVTTKK